MRPRKVVLCVDDNPDVLGVRRFLLENWGYRVLCASSGAEALEILDHALPRAIHLLLTDLRMPGMDGNELIRRAKEMNPELPALLVSGTITGYLPGLFADCFLSKGALIPTELRDRVRTLTARKRGPKKIAAASVETGAREMAVTA